MIKLVFFANKPLGEECLKNALELQKEGDIEVVYVVSNSKDVSWWGKTHIKELCQSNATPYFDLTESDLDKLPAKLDQNTWLISVQNSLVFKPEFLQLFNGKSANLHLAPLPKYRGWYGPSHAILQGEKSYGWTIHQMTESLDVGSILESGTLEISPRDTAKSLYERTETSAIRGFNHFLKKLILGQATFTPMDLTVSKYYGKLSLDPYRTINLDKTSPEECDRIIRGMYFPPYPMPRLVNN